MQMNDMYYRHAHRSQEEIDVTKKRYQLFDVSLIPQIFKKALGLTAVSWVRPDSYGTIHVIYKVRVKEHAKEYLLRANISIPKPEAEMKLEQLITEKVAPLGVPVSRILHVDISRRSVPFDFQIQEVLPGVDLEDHFEGTKEDYDRMSFTLGTYVARLAELRFERFGRFAAQEVHKNTLIGTKASFPDYIAVRLDEDLRFLVDGGC